MQIGLRQQKEQRALALIFGGRPGALEAIGKYLAGLAHLPSPAKPLTPGDDHFKHADGLGPLLLPVSLGVRLLRPPPLDGCSTYNAAGWKANKIDDRK